MNREISTWQAHYSEPVAFWSRPFYDFPNPGEVAERLKATVC